MKRYNCTATWRGATDAISGRTSVIRAATVGDAMGIMLDRIERNTRPEPIEVVSISVAEA